MANNKKNIEYIKKTDTLNEGREKFNETLSGFQTQIDEIIVEGDSSVEAAQARVDEGNVAHPTLKARIDDGITKLDGKIVDNHSEVTSQLADIVTLLSDFPSVQDAIDHTPFGAELKLDVIPEPEEVFVNGSIIINFNGLEALQETNKNVIKFKGIPDQTIYSPITPIKKGHKKIELDQSSNFEEGDLIIVRDSSVREVDNSRDVNMEVHKVYTVVGNEVILCDSMSFDKLVYPVEIYKFTPSRNITLKNVKAIGVDGDLTPLVDFEMCENVNVKNIKGKNTVGPLIRLRSCYNSKVEGFELNDPLKNQSGQGYGVRVDGGSNGTEIHVAEGKKNRHLIDLGNSLNTEVKDVLDLGSESSGITLSHSGFDDKITLEKFKTLHSRYIGVNTSLTSEGAPERLSSMKIKEGEISLLNPGRYGKGMSFMQAIENLVIEDVSIDCDNGQDSVGIQVSPKSNMIAERVAIKNTHTAYRFNANDNLIGGGTGSQSLEINRGLIEDCNFFIRSSGFESITIKDTVIKNVENIMQHPTSVGKTIKRFDLINLKIVGATPLYSFNQNAFHETCVGEFYGAGEGVLNVDDGGIMYFADILKHAKGKTLEVSSTNDVVTNYNPLVPTGLDTDLILSNKGSHNIRFRFYLPRDLDFTLLPGESKKVRWSIRGVEPL